MQQAPWREIARHTRLPWAVIERQRERVAQARAERLHRHGAATAEIAAIAEDNRARPVDGHMERGMVRHLAHQRAELMKAVVNRMPMGTRAMFLDRLNAILPALDARPMKERKGLELAGVVARVTCPLWWNRQLWRAAVQDRERLGRESAEVCAIRRQPYLTDDTVRRLLNKDAETAAMLARTELENEDGQVMTLADLAAVSTANPAIRRGELMTRTKGCEVWADANGWRGIFTGNTTPSRFHAVTHTGKLNPKWEEAGRPSPKDGQAWLCDTWALCRTAMANKGLQVFGLRVAEPHQDGTPHWHMLLWVKPSDAEAAGVDGCCPGSAEKVMALMRRYWLRDSGDERGAREHRFSAQGLQKGGAAGYIAKYIAKGIDDAGTVAYEGHVDDLPDNRKMVIDQKDMFGGGATRVRMWARAHGIRQFQPIGQPPVTVWRELRRVGQDDASRGTDRLLRAWHAANRDGDRQARWDEFMVQQGGACVGRGYLVAVATEDREAEGRYETATRPCPVGVVDRLDAAGYVAASARKTWRPRGADRGELHVGPVIVGLMDVTRAKEWRRSLARPQAAQPRTRVNNCTGSARETEEMDHGRQDPGAYRLPDMRHEGRHAHHARQERRPVRLLRGDV